MVVEIIIFPAQLRRMVSTRSRICTTREHSRAVVRSPVICRGPPSFATRRRHRLLAAVLAANNCRNPLGHYNNIWYTCSYVFAVKYSDGNLWSARRDNQGTTTNDSPCDRYATTYWDDHQCRGELVSHRRCRRLPESKQEESVYISIGSGVLQLLSAALLHPPPTASRASAADTFLVRYETDANCKLAVANDQLATQVLLSTFDLLCY